MCIDWEQLDTGYCHQNADLQKVEQALAKSVWCMQYGFVDADQTDAVGTRKDWGIRPAPLSLPGSFHLRAHWQIKQLYAVLRDRKKKEKKEPGLWQRSNVRQTSADAHAVAAEPLPTFVHYRGKAFTKRGQGHEFPLWDHHLH